MLPTEATEAAARHLLGAYTTGTPVEPLADATPTDRAEVYAIQAEVMARLGAVGAFKIGRKSVDETPFFAPIRAATILPSGAGIASAESRLRGVELEVAFRFETDPPAPDAPGFEDALRAAVVALPAIEIVEARLKDPDAVDPLWKLADNQANGAVVVGEPVENWQALDLAERTVRLDIGGATVHEGARPAPGGDPFASLAAFVKAVGDHCGGLHAGQVVICGSLTGCDYAKAGDRVAGEIGGLGRVETRFA